MQAKPRSKKDQVRIIRIGFLFLLAAGAVFVAICYLCRGLDFVKISEDLTYPALLFTLAGLSLVYYAMDAYLMMDKGADPALSMFPFPYEKHRRTALVSFFVSVLVTLYALTNLLLSFNMAQAMSVKGYTLLSYIGVAVPFLVHTPLMLLGLRKAIPLKTFLWYALLQLIIFGLLLSSFILVAIGKLDFSACCIGVVLGLAANCLLGTPDEETTSSPDVSD